MERGYIKMKENKDNQLIIEAKLVNCTLWMTKHEIADLFNVFVNTIGNNLRAIFKSGLLEEDEVTYTEKQIDNGHMREVVYYNLETLIFISYRIASCEAKTFREWVINALYSYNLNDHRKTTDVLILYNLDDKLPSIILN